MRVLVTGAAGFVARHLVPELEAHGHEVFTTDVVPVAPGMPHYAVCDLCQAEAVRELMVSVIPDGIIHLAGISFVPDAAKDPGRLYAINISGTQHVLDAFKTVCPGGRFLFVSTAQVYGCTYNPESEPLAESAPVYPLSPYAISKVAGEAVTQAYGAYNGLHVCVVRPSNHTGPGQATKFIVPSIVEQAKAIKRGEKTCFVAGNLASGRDFSDVRDVVAAYRIVLENGTSGGVYNVSAAPRVTIHELFETIKAVAGVEAPIETNPNFVRPTDFSRQLMTDKLRSLGWSPKLTLVDTLRDMFR